MYFSFDVWYKGLHACMQLVPTHAWTYVGTFTIRSLATESFLDLGGEESQRKLWKTALSCALPTKDKRYVHEHGRTWSKVNNSQIKCQKKKLYTVYRYMHKSFDSYHVFIAWTLTKALYPCKSTSPFFTPLSDLAILVAQVRKGGAEWSENPVMPSMWDTLDWNNSSNDYAPCSCIHGIMPYMCSQCEAVDGTHLRHICLWGGHIIPEHPICFSPRLHSGMPNATSRRRRRSKRKSDVVIETVQQEVLSIVRWI